MIGLPQNMGQWKQARNYAKILCIPPFQVFWQLSAEEVFRFAPQRVYIEKIHHKLCQSNLYRGGYPGILKTATVPHGIYVFWCRSGENPRAQSLQDPAVSQRTASGHGLPHPKNLPGGFRHFVAKALSNRSRQKTQVFFGLFFKTQFLGSFSHENNFLPICDRSNHFPPFIEELK